jgi:FtsH-binding integral membrane protein
MYTNELFIVQGFMMHIVSIGISFFLICQMMDSARNSEGTRMLYLAALAFQMGFLVGPAIHMLAEFEPGLLGQAVLYTATAFIGFSAVSLLSKRRAYLFLGSVIVTLVQGMLLYRLFNWLFGSGQIGLGYLMVGLFVECLYVIYDTQVIIERAEAGFKDVISDTLRLFIDLFDLFIRILQILMKLKEDEDRKKRNKK